MYQLLAWMWRTFLLSVVAVIRVVKWIGGRYVQ